MRIWAKEPLLHFLLIGAGLFFFHGWVAGPASQPGAKAVGASSEIVVTQTDIRQLAETFERTWQRPPSAQEVKDLVESFVRDEIYYREALAIGLERDDSVIRRRLRMKMEYIFEDIAAQGEPADADLEAFFKKNAGRYLIEPRIAFRHVYVSAGKRGKKAETYARQLLAELDDGDDPATLGDPFLLGSEVGLAALGDISRQFGESFAESLRELRPGSWQGPIPSGYGLHLVLVTKSAEARLPAMREVLAGVKRDWAAERQQQLKDAAYARLRERYTVAVEKPEMLVSAEAVETAGGTVSR